MSDYDGAIYFKDWLPDQPELGNPGVTQAQNVIPLSGSYTSYAPLSTTGNALASNVRYALRATGTGGDWLYAGISGALTGFLYRGANTAGSWSSVSASTFTATGNWSMAQYEEFVIATNGAELPQFHTLGSASNFATLGSSTGDAPQSRVVGVIGQFVVLGNLPSVATYALQWSGIDAPTSWPTPNSATAIAQQSGQQLLDPQFGGVNGIFGGDQFGLIFQAGGISRMTYIGGDAVFQFDQISQGIGLDFINGAIRVGGLVYFASLKGFFVTDGVSIVPIGTGKVNEYFLTRVSNSLLTLVCAGIDWRRKLVFWTFPATGDTSPTSALVYNYEEKRWSLVVDTIRYFVRGNQAQLSTYGFEAFGNDNKIGRFTGTPGSAILTTGELEPNAGGYSAVQGVKPLVDQTLNGITVAMGTRNDRSSAVSYTAEQTANSRSGFASFRTAAKYHRARLTITGTFNAGQGLEYQAVPDGYT